MLEMIRHVMRVYRWDLDKTYLETDFESLRGLLRTATEPATLKEAVPGATALMRALGEQETNRITIVSGSPVQMREVLLEKLSLDGVRVDELVLKDSLGHFRRGQFRAIRGQFGYKLPVLLRQRAGLGRGTTETLFGDDVEVDALVYSVYADAIAGRLTPADVSRIMEVAGAYPEHIDAALEALADLPRAEAVERIFIRLERPRAPAVFDAFGRRVVPVFSWWQAALVLVSDGALSGDAAEAVLDDLVRTGAQPFELTAWTQDIIRRGFVEPPSQERLSGFPSAVRETLQRATRSMGVSITEEHRSRLHQAPDYMALVRGWSRR